MTSGPLGRDGMAFREKMKKYHGEIERLVYAAEILCHSDDLSSSAEFPCETCPFHPEELGCSLWRIRAAIGEPVKQQDIQTETASLEDIAEYEKVGCK